MPQTWVHSANKEQDFAAGMDRSEGLIGRRRGGADRDPDSPRPALALTLLILTFLGLALARPARAQEERRSKVPVIGKIAGGSTRQAFSGKVESVDLKRKLLSVQTVEGGATEFFPIKKNVAVATAGGEKLKVQELSPGTNIIVYYEVREDRRSVSEIMVLGPGGEEKATDANDKDTKKPAPPS